MRSESKKGEGEEACGGSVRGGGGEEAGLREGQAEEAGWELEEE